MNELKGQLGLDEWLELIKEDKNLNGAYISIAQYVDLIEKENQQLKIQISAKEEKYKKLEGQINEYKRLGFKHLQDKNNKLEDNWNKLKEHFEFLKINSTGGNREFMEDIVSLMENLERGVSDER